MAHTRLYSADVPSVSAAMAEFGENSGLLICRPGRSSFTSWFSVPEGAYAIVSKHGADIPFPETGKMIWPTGFHWGYPWQKVQYLITKQSVVFNMEVKQCFTADNVPIDTDVTIIFRIMGDEALGENPELVTRFLYNLKPDGLESQLVNAMEEAMRALARSIEHTEAFAVRSCGPENLGPMTNIAVDTEEHNKIFVGQHDEHEQKIVERGRKKARNVTEGMIKALNKQFNSQGVEILDVNITNINLPHQIVQQMSNKTFVISANALQHMNQIYEMQALKFRSELLRLEESYLQTQESETQKGKKELNTFQVQLNELKASAKKQLELFHGDVQVSIQNINAESKLECTRLQQEKARVLADFSQRANAESKRIIAETSLYTETKLAESMFEVSKNEASANQRLAEAEGVMAPLLNSRKLFETQLKELEIYEALGNNNQLILSATDDQELNTIMLCDSILGSNTNSNRSRLLAEMMTMQKAADAYLQHPMAEQAP